MTLEFSREEINYGERPPKKSKDHKVFRRKRSKACEPVKIPLGGDFKPGPDYEPKTLFGPDRYSACSQWINENCDDKLTC